MRKYQPYEVEPVYLLLSIAGQSPKPANLSRNEQRCRTSSSLPGSDELNGSGDADRFEKQPRHCHFYSWYVERDVITRARCGHFALALSRKRARPALTPPSAPLGARIDSPEARPKRAAASRIASYSEANPKTSLFQSAAAHSGGSAQRNPTYSTTQEDDSRAFQPGSTADK